MGKNEKNVCKSIKKNLEGCRMESVITIDGRGQTVIPKSLRDRAGIRAGDKLTVVSWEKDKKIHCISLIRSEEFAVMVKEFMGSVLKDMIKA